MRKFCIIANRDKDENLETTNWIIDYLTSKQISVFVAEERSKENDGFYTEAASIPEDIDIAIVLGGDGTILQAAHDLITLNIPFMGINLGTLGFLAETEKHSLQEALDALLNNQYKIEKRMMIKADINQTKVMEHNPLYSSALNDVVITRSGFSRIIGVSIYVNGAYLNDFRGDGVIVSTPTGSTGYNLSAGGPVVTPGADLIIITPICPHTLNARSIVVTSQDTVLIKIRESKKTQEEEAILTIDGSSAMKLEAGDSIEIKKAAEEIQLIRVKNSNFFQILRNKLGSLD